jgi:hypothetical protein
MPANPDISAQGMNTHNLGGTGTQKYNANAANNLNNNRPGLPGRGLGGVGGSIISSSGINQNFKDYSAGAVKGTSAGPNPPATQTIISNKAQR